MYYTVRCYNAVMGIIECGLCQRAEKYKRLDIRDFEHWGLTLFENQYYLGRSIIFLKRHAVDFFINITQEEHDEFCNITKMVRNSIKELYNPDLFNYATLGNEVDHLHWHIIPRYKSERKIDGIIFKDENWGKNYAPYNREFTVPDEIQIKIRDEIKSKL